MGRGRGRPRYKGHSRHFTSRDELEEERKKDEAKAQKRREEGREDDSTSSEEEEEESSSEEEEEKEPGKPKGVEGLIEISNPNQARKVEVKAEKVEGQTAQLTRRQREELARQKYQKLQMECKTDQAQKDLARLAIIRKQREEAQGASPGPAGPPAVKK